MRQDSVNALLSHAKADLAKIEEDYNASLQQKDIVPSLQIDIKNLMENLRSALDYMAHDIYEKIIRPVRNAKGQPEVSMIYFPYGKDKNDFKSAIGRSFPELDSISGTVFFLVERIQPHKCGNSWLYDFCSILNDNKHNSLTPQTRKERKSYKIGPRRGKPAISAPAGAIKAPPGAIRIGDHPVIFDPNTEIPYPTPGLQVEVTTWISFLFTDTNVEVLPLLRLANKEIESLAKDLYIHI
jgi:hypothetical protein